MEIIFEERGRMTEIGEQGVSFKSLVRAVTEEDAIRVVELLDKGARVNSIDADGFTPLHYAAMTNVSDRVAQVLISRGADPDARADDDSTPISLAERHGRSKVLDTLKKIER